MNKLKSGKKERGLFSPGHSIGVATLSSLARPCSSSKSQIRPRGTKTHHMCKEDTSSLNQNSALHSCCLSRSPVGPVPPLLSFNRCTTQHCCDCRMYRISYGFHDDLRPYLHLTPQVVDPSNALRPSWAQYHHLKSSTLRYNQHLALSQKIQRH